jgi:pilus assembly protein CpaE
LIGTCERHDEIPALVRRVTPQVLVVDLEPDPEEAMKGCENLSQLPLLVVVGPDDNVLLRRALRLGAREYITPELDLAEQLLGVFGRAAEERSPQAEGKLGKLVAVLGAKGGTGSTFVACQAGAALARLGASVAVADLHLRLGDVAVYLNVKPQYSLASLATDETVDAAYLRSVLVSHPSGLQVLAAPPRLEDGDRVDAAAIERTLALLRREADFIVADVPRDFDDRAIAVLDRADLILLVSTPEVPSLNRASLQIDLLLRLGYPPSRVRVVVNRDDREHTPPEKELEAFLHHPVDARLPNDFPSASACANEGRTIFATAGRSELAAALDGVARQINTWCGSPVTPRDPEARSGIRAIFSRKRNAAS